MPAACINKGMQAWASKKLRQSRSGFTIIELLVVMVVIAILVTITVVAYTGIQQRSRDARRESDVTKLKIAIEKYHADKSQYPDVCPGGDSVDCAVSNLTSALQPYLSEIPHDPTQVADSHNDYRYVRDAPAFNNYGILVTYEARAICRTGENINTNWWSVGWGTVVNC